MQHGFGATNTTWYRDVNHFAVQTPELHGPLALYSHDLGIGLLALFLLLAWWRARSRPFPARAVASVLWAAGGTVAAWVLAHYVLKPAVAERRPYLVMRHVEVLLTRTHEYSFPSGHATIAGAVIIGLWLSRDWIMAFLGTVFGLFLAFGRIYTGMHYPFDVVGGLLIGGVLVAVFFPLAVTLLTWFDEQLAERTPLAFLVLSRGRTSRGSKDVFS
jgi:membrane-associated phospholipid phosphatase